MISMSIDGGKRVTAAIEEFVEEAKIETSGRLKNMGYAISGTTESLNRRYTADRLHMYPSVRQIGDDVRLRIQFKRANAGARKIARRSLSAASRYIWTDGRAG